MHGLQIRAIGATGGTTDNYDVSGIAYDKNGNIMSLTRRGHTDANATTFGNMDILGYTYASNSNQLTKVADTGNTTYGFKDGTNTGDDYTYDVNGNMITDENKGISSIAYNHLNLPTSVGFSGQQAAITYVYDATGVKLKKTVAGSGLSTITTDYAGNHIYENGDLQFFNHAEGYVKHTNSNGYEYVYQYKDHLGNVRLSYADTNNDGTIDAATEIIEESNYYPFGLKHKGYNNVISSNGNSTAQKFKYNGKELDEDLGLNWYHYGFRVYDAALGRFPSIDPASDKFPHVSTYNYAENEPVGSIDLWGLQRWKVNGRERTEAFSKEKINRARGAFARNNREETIDIAVSKNNKANAAYNMAVDITTDNGGNIVGRGRGSKRNAFRHSLISAMITSHWGEKTAKEATNAYEGIESGEVSTIDFTEKFEGENLELADTIVDLLNNQIGIEVGKENEMKGTINMAKAILDKFKTDGMWTFKKENGTITFEKTKLNKEEYNRMLKELTKIKRNESKKKEKGDY